MALKACSHIPARAASCITTSYVESTVRGHTHTHTVQTLSQEVVLKVQRTDAHSAGESRAKLKASKDTPNTTVRGRVTERGTGKIDKLDS